MASPTVRTIPEAADLIDDVATAPRTSAAANGQKKSPEDSVTPLLGGSQSKETRQIADEDKALFSTVLIAYWGALLALYAALADYGPLVLESTTRVDGMYLYYHNITIMIFVGFGFLMTFLHRYAFGAVGYTFLVGVLCIFSGTLCSALFHQCSREGCAFSTVHVDLGKLIEARIFQKSCIK